MEMADGDRFTPEQAEALRALRDGRNVFLSGNAGTGKSYVLNAFISDLKARNVDFLALAPTGIAALNLTDGSTIHRTLKIAPGVCAPDGPKGSRKVLDAAKVIIIDEISMCRIDLFDHVMGMISQSMTRNGAKQVVLVGDFFRLPDGSEPAGYAEMSVPADYADSSHVVPSVFISGTGGDRAWRDIDFDEAERKFAAAARGAAAFRGGRPKLMQDEARRAAIRETRHRACTAPILKSIKEIHR